MCINVYIYIYYIILYIPFLPTGGVTTVDLQQWSFIPFLVAERQDFSAGSRAAIGGGVLDNYQYRIQVSRLGKGLNIGRKTMKKHEKFPRLDPPKSSKM